MKDIKCLSCKKTFTPDHPARKRHESCGVKYRATVKGKWAKDWRLKVKRLIEKDREGVR